MFAAVTWNRHLPLAPRLLWRAGFILLFAAWWGGLSFYAIVVVPIGTDQIGSVEQGFITQKVTWWHNALLIAMTALLMIEAWWRRNRWLWTIVAGMTLVAVMLLFEHARLTSLMDFANQTVPSGFYQQHAIYLWLTAAEWVLGIFMALLVGQQSTDASNVTIPSKADESWSQPRTR